MPGDDYELFMSVFPYFLSIGMTYDEFWNKDPWLVKSYMEAYETKREQENQRLWLQGLYNYSAFSSVMEMFSYGLGGKKGKKPKTYFEHPIAFTDREKEAERQRKIKHTLEWFEKGKRKGGV